ncbi:MAG: CDP-glycerol glycerophosphotransferase family protein [Paraclostridium sp.]|uniref:CDP-glycerol glycerophosphotransferase family protein n=1 Tax=Paraclostridium sp. TaxID=2023273 RepID=UPI003F3B38EC
MDTINKIKNMILNNDIENAYKLIIENEKEYINNSEYWNLRGMLCFKIQEYDIAISCYETSINIANNYLDGYFNLIYMYKITGEKLKSALYAGIALRYTDDIEFINDINDLYKDEVLYENYKAIINEVKNNLDIRLDNMGFIRYIYADFNGVDEEYIRVLAKNNICQNWAYVKANHIITSKEILTIDSFIVNKEHFELEVVVPYDINYISVVRELALKGLEKCFIMLSIENKFKRIEIDYKTMQDLKNKDFDRTITFNKFNAADSNVNALIKYMPEKYKGLYKINLINGRDVFDIENMIKVPLVSSVTVSGFNTFVSYPKFTYNIDVGHGAVSFKAAGLMDKKNKNFAFTPEEYKNIDKVCITSNMNMLTLSSMAAIPEDKYEITGNPRTDTLLLTDGKKNLEKLLGKSIGDKKVVFNMPTFHVHENTGLASGSKELNDVIKIKDFDYQKFDEFLEENNMVCIAKVHHAEERTVTNKNEERKLNNLIFISNKNLDENDLDLYEILNCADLLITDYSSIYGDFLFMNKPTIFIPTDIEQYRKEKGILLEPYDFWTAGPKVLNQGDLQYEIMKSLNEPDYFKQKREDLRDTFYKYKDSDASLRVWDHINEQLSRENRQ